MMTLFPWGVPVLLMVMLIIDRRRLCDGWASRRWLPCQAIILQIQDTTSYMDTVSQSRGGGVNRLEGRAYRYRYEVNGTPYESMRYSFEHEPREDLRALEVDQQITVYYDPTQPRRAVIRRGLTWRSYWLPIAAIASLAFAIWRECLAA
jgi:hypothetical protein